MRFVFPTQLPRCTSGLDLRAGRVTCFVDIDAAKEGRPATRVNWLIRQHKAAPEGLRVEAFAMHGRGTSSASLLKDVREDPTVLIQDPKRKLRSSGWPSTHRWAPSAAAAEGPPSTPC